MSAAFPGLRYPDALDRLVAVEGVRLIDA